MTQPLVHPPLQMIRAAAHEIAVAAGLRLAVLFGSLARGEMAADIDIGLLGTSVLDKVDLTNRFITSLHTQHIDIADLGIADPLLMALVARDGIVLHESEPGEFARFASLATRRFADTAKFREAERQVIADFLERSGHGP